MGRNDNLTDEMITFQITEVSGIETTRRCFKLVFKIPRVKTLCFNVKTKK